ncbi:type II CRISPR-associated endonuclease Cas1 [Candidatus Poriferisocius sp.]|uniref:type II CRISPR-associated endonuclease Cas1 n=1 Tax=Candidatus Poriferisocius sp. TaxID=3101276 RepID=UPI003B02CF0A
MERRVLDIAEGRRYLSKRRGSLAVVCDPGTPEASETLLPFDEIESVIVHTPQASYSNGAILELSRRGIPLVCCDETHTPAAWLWPVEANFEQGRRMTAQAAMSDDLRDDLWADIVRAKLEAQAAVVRGEGFPDDRLLEFARAVLPGDRSNMEAQAARLYWRLLFDECFRRRRFGDAPNGLLNYGYAVLRASVARQLCAAGLHPSLALHHHNRFNPFCLADDLMEPFRPAVDRAVLALWRSGQEEVTAKTKPALVAVMTESVSTDRGVAPLSRCVEWAAQSLAQSVVEGQNLLRLPQGAAIVG